MADSGDVDLKTLRSETQRALLEAIKDKAPKASISQIDGLAYAYALVVGAVPGQLPGGPLDVTVSS